MSDETTAEELEFFENAARFLRWMYRRLGRQSALTKNQLKAYAAFLFNQYAQNGRPIPGPLRLLISELLLDVSAKSPDESGPSREDPIEFLIMHSIILSELDKAMANANIVGAPKYWAAIDYEASQPVDSSGLKPSNASVSAVAKNSGASRDSVRRWRKYNSYRDSVRDRRAKGS